MVRFTPPSFMKASLALVVTSLCLVPVQAQVYDDQVCNLPGLEFFDYCGEFVPVVTASAPGLAISNALPPTVDTIEILSNAIITDLNVQIDISHTWSGDVVIDLLSPSSTAISVRAGGGGGADDVIGTFDDEGVLTPVDALSALDGEDAIGVWTLTVADTAGGDDGTLNSWGLEISSPLAFDNLTSAASTIAVADSYLLGDLNIGLDISHTYISDITATVTAPDMTVVTLHSGQGGSSDDILMTYDDEGVANGSVAYTSGVAMMASGPGSMVDFEGLDVLGNWTLDLSDAFGGDDGLLNSWCMNATSQGGVPISFDLAPTVDSIDVVNSGLVSDLDVFIGVDHTWGGDLSIDLVSPAGTTVTLHDQTGGGDDYIPTNYDDQLLVLGSIAPAIGTLADYNGEEKLGAWTLNLSDSASGDDGVLSEWCLSFATVSVVSVCWEALRGDYCSVPDLGIIDLDTVIDTLTVADSLPVVDLQVAVDITHSWKGDMTVVLSSPIGTMVTLHNETGGSADDILGTYGLDLVVDGPGDLATLTGEDMMGDWTLSISDSANGDDGTLNSWCLSTSIPTVISFDLPAVIETVTVMDNLLIEDINVGLDITHSWVGDLSVDITHPGGATVRLHDGAGNGDDDLIATMDDAGIPNGAPYNSGAIMQPSGPGTLADFNGLSMLGDWTLAAADSASGDDGVLNSFCLNMTGETVACDSNLVADFSVDTVFGPAPLCANFMDLSTGSVETWSWDFGDGTTSDQQSPSVIYAAGVYEVTLTIDGCSATDTLTQSNLVVAVGMGDYNGDGTFDLGDAIGLAGWLFGGGADPVCMRTVDVNADGAADLGDVVYSLSAMFSGGPAPVPAPDCSSCDL